MSAAPGLYSSGPGSDRAGRQCIPDQR